MTPLRSTPTLAQCRKLNRSAEVSENFYAKFWHACTNDAEASAPTRAAALAGLYAILQALPKRRGK